MMRKKVSSQDKLFYGFRIADRVPPDHFLRKVNGLIDQDFIWELARPYYSDTGAPSVDPVVILKMALLGYFYGITSERKLAAECRMNLAFMWFLGYDLDEMPPDHSILSKARSRFGRAVYDQFFGHIVRACQQMGLIDGDKLVMDGTLVRANASLNSLVSRSLYQNLATAPDYLDAVWEDNPSEVSPPAEGKEKTPDPPSSDTNLGETGRKRRVRSNERRISRTDPDCEIVTRFDARGLFLAHKVHVAVDSGKAHVVTAVVTTSGGSGESQQVPELLGQHLWWTRTKPKQVVADKGYSAKSVYSHLRSLKILPAIPLRKPWKTVRQVREQAGFRYDPKIDQFICPEGKKLYRLSQKKDGAVLYKVHSYACNKCPRRETFCKSKRPTMTRRVDEALYSWVSDFLQTKDARRSIRHRAHAVETIFAELKGPRGMSRANLRFNWKVHTQAVLAMTAHNIVQMVRRTPLKGKPASYITLLDKVLPTLDTRFTPLSMFV